MNATRQISAQSIVEGSALSAFHWKLLGLCFLLLVLDGYDLAIAGAALPAIMKDMQVDPATAGFMASSALFGMAIGAIGLGSLADRVGRRRVIALSVFLFSLFTAAAGFCSTPLSFSAMRFLAGVGLGSAIPNIISHVTEYAPAKIRGLVVTSIGCGYPIGSMLAALLGKQLIQSHGWQSVFLAAGLALVLVPVVLRALPESLAYLSKSGQSHEMREILMRMSPHEMKGIELSQLTYAGVSGEKRTPITGLFSNGRGRSTVMLWIAFATNLFLLYALSTWLVQLMTRAGYSLGSALTFLVAFNAGGILGALCGGWLGDRISMKWTLVALYVLCAASLIILGIGGSHEAVLALLVLLGASTLGSQIVLYAFVGSFYPPEMRSTGLGFAAGMGRIGGIVAPIVIGVLVAMELSLAHNFMAIAAVASVGALAVAAVAGKRPEFMTRQPMS